MAHYEVVSASSRTDSFSRESGSEVDEEGTTSGSEGDELETIPDEVPAAKERSPPPPPPPPPASETAAVASREREVRELIEAEFQSRMPPKKGGKTATKKSAKPKKSKSKSKTSKVSKSKAKSSAKKPGTKAASDIAKYRKLATSMLQI